MTGRGLPRVGRARRADPRNGENTPSRRDEVQRLSRRLQRVLARDRGPISPAAAKLDPRDTPRAARLAKLRYVSDEGPGLRRTGKPGHFQYVSARGAPVTDAATRARIDALAIPPAWTDVWICPIAHGHIQATGRDARGRKQYRYHPRWRQVRDETKFGRMIAFARALPRIRRAVARDLRGRDQSRDKVIAGVVRLLERTCIRVGNDEYARDNGHFGITTLEDRHARVAGAELRFRFRGKSGKEHEVGLSDPTLARLVRRCRDIPGQRLFQYIDDDGRRRSVGSGDVNAYLRKVSGASFTAKDFRTWAGTTLVAAILLACQTPRSVAGGNREVLRAIDAAAERLGNTRAVCRSSYVHPAVIDAFMSGRLVGPAEKPSGRRKSNGKPNGGDSAALCAPKPSGTALGPLERATLRVLEAAAR